MSSRISEHPILGEQQKGKLVTFTYDGKELQGYEGEPIAAAIKSRRRDGSPLYQKGTQTERNLLCDRKMHRLRDGRGWKTKCPHLHDTACRGHESPDTVRRIG